MLKTMLVPTSKSPSRSAAAVSTAINNILFEKAKKLNQQVVVQELQCLVAYQALFLQKS